ncbi:MAG: chitobiase/beta-hexosaminidase C-terminal domain-containing protein, partial [Chloroflexi bacterium]|nr:chitobiase/beta-hexosaminidase C-terminal domain-containing protein [Chloroflexota bacterium]
NKNNLGQYIPVAIPDTTTYPGSDYYEFELGEYTERMHTDLPAPGCKLRGYRQTNTTDTTVSTFHYLGPLIVAQKNRAVRVKLTNRLPTGAAGKLFIPNDTTLLGNNLGPLGGTEYYTENRATLHLHGGFSPWISDGTPHQWGVPVGETTSYPRGVSTQDVPDMPATVQGEQTFYWTNQQSSRLMFYHDHALGVTRLNVYVGEVAGYLITDSTEQTLVASGAIPAEQIPLIIQDKTFVPDAATLAAKDPLWDTAKWGGMGSLWFPHVYVPADLSPGVPNPLGRWDYGAYLVPPATVIGPLPHPSHVPESFMDTALVNGTAYPYVNVQPKAYRFRILNGCNDRFVNLQLYYVDPADPNGTEVAMVPADGATYTGPYGNVTVESDLRPGGVPHPAQAGPKIAQIGNEGGFLPYPMTLNAPPVPIGWDNDPASATFGNVARKNLVMGPAERSDIIIDFSQVPPGSKLILYNDAPSAFPGGDPRYDYYTGNPDLSAEGGAPSTVAGYGPNVRTIMQFRVAGTPATPFDYNALAAQLPAAYVAGQDAPIIPQPGYPPPFNAATGTYATLNDTSLTFTPYGSTTPVTVPFQIKSVAAKFDDYGRIRAILGTDKLVVDNTGTLMPGFGYVDPVTETLPEGQIQIWRLMNTDVDVHIIHWHLVDVQVINRVNLAGLVTLPDANEMGWKESLRVNPLEDTFIAVRAKRPSLPFAVPDSVRPLDPTAPLGVTLKEFTNPWPYTGQPTINVMTNFGWEYVWHCHILGHEENDMMRPLVMTVASSLLPGAPTIGAATAGNSDATISFTAPTTGGGSISSYTATASPGGIKASGTASPITVVGLTNGVSYTFTVAAANASGTGPSSAPSNAVIPTSSLGAPITTANPIAGTYTAAPILVTLSTDKPATIYYTTDGTTPTTTSTVYGAPISVGATTTIKYFAVDAMGNTETVKTGTWTVHTSDLVASVRINNSASITNSQNVTLALNAYDPVGVASMQFSND